MSGFSERRNHRRTIFLALFFLLWAGVISARLFELQVLRHSQLKAEVNGQSRNKRSIIPERGAILDRNGKVLAETLPAPSVCFQPLKDDALDSRLDKLNRLKKILDLSDSDYHKIKARIVNKENFTFLKRKTDDETARRAMALNLDGVFLQEENKRFYPLGPLAAHVLGGVDVDNEGQSGIEFRFNSTLGGEKGQILSFRDAYRRDYQFEILKPAAAGKDIVLTIDETLQYIAQKELEKAVAENEANWGTVIVSNPASGEILAIANCPSYDPNDYPPSSPEAGRNRAIQDIFEPGSTFKIVTASAALETNLVRLTDYFDCSKGSIQIGRSPVRDHKLMGILSFPDVIIHSSNVGTIQVGLRLGPEALYNMVKAYNFGEKTGIELPGEEDGTFRSLKTWNKVSTLPHIAIGYEIGVTALQMLQAMNVVANRGLMLPARIVKKIAGRPSSAALSQGPPERIITEQTASELTEIFRRVVEEGTGTAAQIPGYDIAGKTGTAQKYDRVARSYSSAKHLASFVGFAPAEKPVISIIVVLDEPKIGEHYGGLVAAPIFREIARRSLFYLHVLPKKLNSGLVVAAQLRDQKQ
jgi:cell division protein FtsI/penicillin-binding protein 2